MSDYLGFMPATRQNYYFLSYNHDDADKVSAIACAINNAGVPLWYDYGLQYGEEWERQISSKIADSQAVILLFTKGILYKNGGYVEKEYKIAEAFDKKIYVLLLEEVTKYDVPNQLMGWWVKISDAHYLSIWQWNNQKKTIKEVYRALGLDPDEGKYNDIAYPCPYCGRMIVAKDVLFINNFSVNHTDMKYGAFLRWHGVNENMRNVFAREYYKVKPGINVIYEDCNGFPMEIEERRDNACAPEDLDLDELNESNNSEQSNNNTRAKFSLGDLMFDMSPKEVQDKGLYKITERACPHCHCRLPQKLGMIDTHHVLMLDSFYAGKTTFLINLLNQLEEESGQNHLGRVSFERESREYLRSVAQEMTRHTVHATPRRVLYRGMMPIVFDYQYENNESYIVINDIASEGIMDPYFAAHHGIADSEVLLLLVDPDALSNGDHENRLDNILDEANMICHTYAKKIKDIICLITKLDSFIEDDEEILNAGHLEFMENMGNVHHDAVDLQTLKKVEDDLSQYINKKYGVNLKERLIATFGSEIPIRILGISCYTRKTDQSGKIIFESDYFDLIGSGFKHRISEPVFAMLADFGLVPTKGLL